MNKTKMMPHNLVLPSLRKYQATDLELDSINATFELVERNVHLQLLGNPTVTGLFPASGGLYLFVLNLNGETFKIYLGRTKSLLRRMCEYTRAFQPHSPNDYKLQAFQSYLSEILPTATLDLRFQRLSGSDLKRAETDAIRKYSPLLNELIKPTSVARQAFQEAFSQYVRSTFEQRLQK